MAEHNIFTRSSPVGRKSLVRILQATGDPGQIHKLKLKQDYRNVNADIFNAYLKSWGIRVNFMTDIDGIEDVIMDVVQPFSVHGYTVFDLPSRRDIYSELIDTYEDLKNEQIVILDDTTDLNTFLWDQIFAMDKYKDVDPGIQQVCRAATNGEFTSHDNTKDEDDDE